MFVGGNEGYGVICKSCGGNEEYGVICQCCSGNGTYGGICQGCVFILIAWQNKTGFPGWL